MAVEIGKHHQSNLNKIRYLARLALDDKKTKDFKIRVQKSLDGICNFCLAFQEEKVFDLIIEYNSGSIIKERCSFHYSCL